MKRKASLIATDAEQQNTKKFKTTHDITVIISFIYYNV